MNAERRIVSRICALTALVGLAAVVSLATLPKSDAIRPSAWWVLPLIAVGYALAERTVFHFEFRREAISFSISEVPTVFALVYLAPGPAVAARLIGSLAIIAFQWRQKWYKLLFNAALFTLELGIAYQLTQRIYEWRPHSAVILLFSLAGDFTVAFVTGSILVSVAISLIEGGFKDRLIGELKVSGWVLPVNAMVAAAMVAPTLLSPWLAVLSAVPLIALWAVMRGYGNLEQRFRDLDALHGFVRKVGPSLDITELAATAARESAARLRARRAGIVIFDDTNGNRRHDVGEPLPQLPRGISDHRWVALFAAPEAKQLDLDQATAWGLERLGRVGDVLVAPIVDGATVLGLLALAERDGAEDHFSPGDVNRLATMVDQLAPTLRKAMLHERIEFEARHDALTGLPNRSSFERAVDAEIALHEAGAPEVDDREEIGVVIMMDLDRFKEVNDTLGHHAGDSLLMDFSRRLKLVLRNDDVLARLAGDEFSVLCKRTVDGMHQLAGQLVNEARRPFTIDGLEVVVTMSVGVAPMVGEMKDASTLLRRADIAMYTAKNQHTGYELYRDEIDRRTPARLSMLGDLRNALEHHDLMVHLQPKLDLATGVVIGVEALARWAHPQRGWVSPEDFVHVAEETGLIKQLTDLVLEASIQQLSQLKAHGHHLGLAVNLSTHDLLDELLADRVLRRLDQYGVDPALLTLEITESSLLIDAPRARNTIDRINRAGIRLSVDDFGTGYSSLSYLRRLPVSELKIDRSFVSNLLLEDQDEVIVKSIIDLGHNLGMQVVAEGVETDEIMNRLRGFGCDVAQGFGICRPIPYDQFLTWLNATSHPSRRKDPMSAGEWLDDPV
jgi:diguanylate cyclase (GGDEF)-like protein